MELKHPDIKSSVFKLIGTYELDLSFCSQDEADEFSLRIELFRSLNKKNLFRCKSWKNEFFRIQSTFPQDDFGGHLHAPSDEMILVKYYFGEGCDFFAETPKEALNKIIEDLSKLLEHVTLKKIEIKQ